MKVGVAALALALLVSTPAAAQVPLREVNITQGSTPGWIPSEELEAEALATWQRFNERVETGDYDAAYAMIGDGLRAGRYQRAYCWRVRLCLLVDNSGNPAII
jgi:hypothetical protein